MYMIIYCWENGHATQAQTVQAKAAQAQTPHDQAAQIHAPFQVWIFKLHAWTVSILQAWGSFKPVIVFAMARCGSKPVTKKFGHRF